MLMVKERTNWTLEKVREYIWQEAQYELLSTEYINVKSKLKARCSQGDEWEFTLKEFHSGTRCRHCYDRIRGCGLRQHPGKEVTRYSIEEIADFLRAKGYELLSSIYENRYSKIQCKCPKGHSWSTTWDLFRKGQRCKLCNQEERNQKKYEKIKQHFEKERFSLVSTKYENGFLKLLSICPHGIEYEVSWNDFSRGQRCSCGKTYWTIEQIQNCLQAEGYTLISNEYKTCKDLLIAKCPKGNMWQFRMNDFQQGHRCPCCTTYNRSEEEIAQLYQYMNATKRDRSIISPYELDLYFPEQKVAIEYCGLYWHSNMAPGNRITSDYHRKKMDLCNKQGIRLLTIFEDEWLSNKDICISRINSALGIIKEQIYARKCVVRQITKQEAYRFLHRTHLQGSGVCKIAYGLFYNDRLVQVMTFGVPNRAHTSKGKKVLEMKRLASELNIIVMGGASKLFKVILQYAKNNGYEIIKSYCDLRWGTGNLYKKLGFTKTSDGSPSIHYTNFKCRYRNQRLAQNKQKTGIKESEVAKQKGLAKIYDCGHQTWEYVIC